MQKYTTIGSALVMAAAIGCAGGEATVEDAPSTATDEHVLSRFEGPNGGSVEWIATDEGVDVSILAVYPHAPPIAPDLVEKHGPLLAWLAMAPEQEAIPEALVLAVEETERERIADQTLIAEVRATHRAQQDEIVTQTSALSLGDRYATSATGCTTSFKNWVRSSYGAGYGSSSTCGNATTQWPGNVSQDHFYCNLSGQDCDHPLGSVDSGSCYPALADCHAVRGRQFSKVARVTETYGNASYTDHGHRYRFGVANCSGNGPLQMNRQAAGGTAKQNSVGVGSMLIRVGGSSALHDRAIASTNVTYGLWDSDIGQSGSSYKQYHFWLTNNTASGDRAIVCVDLQREIQMSDISSCWGISLCPQGNSCTGSCYD